MNYPFQPKSTVHMREGQFWPIPLANGRFACGMVLDVVKDSKREFLAALVNWSGSEEPNPKEVAACEIAAQGIGHIKMIQEGFGWITGVLPPEVQRLCPLLWTEHLRKTEWGLYQGLELIEVIGAEQAGVYPRRQTWGHNVINMLAEKRFGTQRQDIGDG